MKKIDDKKIIDTIKKDTNYQIRTSSADILRKYRSEVATEAIQTKEKHAGKRFFIFGGLGVSIAAAAALLVVVGSHTGIIGGDKNQPDLLPDATITNNSFKEQLVAFSAFTHASEDNSINSLLDIKCAPKPLEESNSDTNQNKPQEESNNEGKPNKPEEEEEETTNPNQPDEHISQERFEEICHTYDDLSVSLLELHKETEFKGKDFNQKIEATGKTYKYVNEIYFKGEAEPFAKMYFNSEDLVTEEEGETEIEALYEANTEYYKVKIESEVENDGAEQEREYKLKFQSVSRDHSYQIKKEQEFEGMASESCYSYVTYSDRNFRNEVYKLKYKSEIEVDKEKLEVQLVKDNKEYLFEDIVESVKELSFVASLEDPIKNPVAKDVYIEGVKDATGTTYKHDALTIRI